MTEILRWVLATLTTGGLLVSVATWGIRRHDVPESTRRRGLALVPVMAGLDYGALYALQNHLPLNKALWIIVPAVAVFDAVWGFYFFSDAKP